MNLEVYTNSTLKPSEVNDFPWLFYENSEFKTKYPNEIGKWMMFFRKGQELDEKWSTACDLYRNEKLTGILSMKVSTNYENDRATSKNDGVLIFYCGPCNDETLIMDYGRNLLKHIPYKPAGFGGYMYYKSDKQTMAGTRATGQTKNYM